MLVVTGPAITPKRLPWRATCAVNLIVAGQAGDIGTGAADPLTLDKGGMLSGLGEMPSP
jgi:hypothetical protein